MTDDEQKVSPLRNILPQRTEKRGTLPGVTSKQENDEGWWFPTKELTERKKIKIKI